MLTDRVFVVTGGGGAIARPILRALRQAGARLAVVDHAAEPAEQAAASVGGLAVTADLATAAGAAEMARQVTGALGPADGLVHTVGGFAMGPLDEVPAEDYDRMFDLNVRTLFHTVRAVLPGMRARGRGFIAGFSSEPAWIGAGPSKGLYAAAKAAVAVLLRSLDGELAGTGVRVAIVYPMGAVDTPANRRAMPDFDAARYIDPEEIAATLVHAASRGPRGRLLELPIFPSH